MLPPYAHDGGNEALLERLRSADERKRMAADIEAEVRGVIAAQEAIGAPPVESLIEDVYEEPTWLLREQLRDLQVGAGEGRDER